MASKIGMPKATFDNKLNENHPAKFTTEELNKLRCVLLELHGELDEATSIDFNDALNIAMGKKQ